LFRTNPKPTVYIEGPAAGGAFFYLRILSFVGAERKCVVVVLSFVLGSKKAMANEPPNL